jgi:starch phosphorylase
VSVETHDGVRIFRVQVFPGDLSPQNFRVELYANPLREGESAVQAMTATEKDGAHKGVLTYSAQVAASRPASDYTARIVPYHANVSVPLETGQILWQR